MSNAYLDRIYLKKHTGVNFQNDWQDYADSLKVRRRDRAIRVMIYIGVFNVAYYRAFAPFMELAKRPEYDIRMGNLFGNQDDIDWADIIYFQRVTDRNIIAESKRARTLGKKVLYDTDDFMHGLPAHHPQKRNIENSRYLIDQDELCKACDTVTVSTDYLKKMYSERYRTPIVVLPNCIRAEDYDSRIKTQFRNDRVYLGWAGSSTHFHDLRVATPAIRELIGKHPKLSLVTLNYQGIEKQPYEDAFEGVPMERRVHIGGTHPHLMGNIIQLLDIGIAPILKNDFNRSKSNCKFMEYAMSGVPMVGTDLEPYQADRSYAALVNDNFSNWYRALEDLILDADRRAALAEKANRWARRRYDIKANLGAWDNLLKGLME